MKIVSRDEFMKMPGTLFYRKITEPWAIETLSVRPFWDSEHDFITMEVGDIDSQDSGDWDDKLTSMAETGASLPMTDDYFGRDGMFERDAKFLILEPADLLLLKKMVDAALPQQQPFVHPAFPYENLRPAATTDKAIERAAEALHIERNRQWEAIRPGTRNPLIAVTWAEENESFKEQLRQEVRIVLAAVTSASTEAMLNHMADVHLTPTAEKGK